VTRRLRGVPPLVAVLAALILAAAPARAQGVGGRGAAVFLIDGASFEDLLAVPAFRGLAAQGGAGLLSSRTPLRDAIATLHLDASQVTFEDYGTVADRSGDADPKKLLADAERVTAAVSATLTDDLLVVVATPTPPPSSLAAKDDLTGIVLASAPPSELAAAMKAATATTGSLGSLSSDSTRRPGVVVSSDVPATVAAFVGAPAPEAGSVIRVDRGAGAPFDLHERYLSYRRMSVPIQTAAGVYITVVGLLGVGALAKRDRMPRRVLRASGWLTFSFFPLVVALLLVGHLPTLSYRSVVPAIALLTLAGTLVAVRVAARGTIPTLSSAGVAVLVVFLFEGLLGWTAALTPFLGGGELDGGRFFGLPNVEVGLLVGASLFVAMALPRREDGAGLVAAVGLFAGLPWMFTGSNLGASITLFAAAGLWFGIRREGHLGLREAGYALLVTGAGALIVLLAHRYLPGAPTHITRFVEGEEGGVFGTIRHRLGTGFDLIARNPFALIPVIGVPVCLAVVTRAPAPVMRMFVRHPELRHAVLVILVSSVVAYVANDSGAAALGLGFGCAVAGLLFVSLLEEPGKMER